MNVEAAGGPPVKRAQRRNAVRNRAALIAAGSELFNAAGLVPTLDDVAQHAGVGVGTAYRHFPNKYALAEAVFAEAMDAMLEAAEGAVEIADAAVGFEAFFEAVLEPQANKRALGALLRGSPNSGPGADDVQARIERCIDELLRRGHEQRKIRADLTATDIGVLMAAMTHVIDAYGAADTQLWQRILPVLLDGIRADAPTPLTGQPLSTSAFLGQLRGKR